MVHLELRPERPPLPPSPAISRASSLLDAGPGCALVFGGLCLVLGVLLLPLIVLGLALCAGSNVPAGIAMAGVGWLLLPLAAGIGLLVLGVLGGGRPAGSPYRTAASVGVVIVGSGILLVVLAVVLRL